MCSSRYKACWKSVEQKNYKNNPLSLTIEVVKENRTKKTGHTGTLALGFSSDMSVHASLKIHLTIHVTQNNDMERYPV